MKRRRMQQLWLPCVVRCLDLEPLLRPALLSALAHLLKRPPAESCTAAHGANGPDCQSPAKGAL